MATLLLLLFAKCWAGCTARRGPVTCHRPLRHERRWWSLFGRHWWDVCESCGDRLARSWWD